MIIKADQVWFNPGTNELVIVGNYNTYENMEVGVYWLAPHSGTEFHYIGEL